MKSSDEHGMTRATPLLAVASNAKDSAFCSTNEAFGSLEMRTYAADVFAVELLANGYKPVPIPRGTKGPKIRGWNRKNFTPQDFLPSSNIGVLTGHGVVLLDIDVTNKEMADAIVNQFIDRYEARGIILKRTGLAPKVGIPIRGPIGMKKKQVEITDGHKIEVLGIGQQFVAYGQHPAGNMYEWDAQGSLVDHRVHDLPELTEPEIDDFVAWVTETYAKLAPNEAAIEPAQMLSDAAKSVTLDRKIIDLLHSKCNTLATGSYLDWRNIGFGTRAKYRGTELEAEAYDAFVAFSLRWKNGATDRRDIDKLWNSEKGSDGNRIGPGTAITILRRLPSMFLDDAADQPEETVPLAPALEIGAQFTGLAERFYQQLTRASDRRASNIQLAGVLAALSAVIGPCAVIQNGVKGPCCTNLYLLSLAKTGVGKETIRTLVSSALHAADRGAEVLDGAPSDVSFNAALFRLGGRSALLIDEAGILAKANKVSSNSHQRLLIALLMKAYGCGLTRLEARRYADQTKDIEAVELPRPTLMLTSTVQAFAEGSSQEDSANGFFNRFLTFVDDEHIPYKPRGERPDIQDVVNLPDDIVAALSRVVGVHLGPNLPQRLRQIVVVLADDAFVRVEDFKFGEVESHLEAGGTRAETWSRAVENAQRVAGLLAVSDALMDDDPDLSAVICEARHVDLALQMVRRSMAQLESIAHMAGQQSSRLDLLKDRVLRTLEKEGGRATRTQINRGALRSVRFDERNEILHVMVADGEVRRGELPHDGKSGPKPEIFVLPNKAQTGE